MYKKVFLAFLIILLFGTERPYAQQANPIAIEIVDLADSPLGKALISDVAESIRHSKALRLTKLNEPRIQLQITTISLENTCQTANSTIMYNVVWLYRTPSVPLQLQFYLHSYMGSCKTGATQKTADIIVGFSDAVANTARRLQDQKVLPSN